MENNETESKNYCAFVRSWWSSDGRGGLIPCAGRKTYIKKYITRSEAKSICEVWNNNHNPGKYSRKAEFDSI
jgi:hypothetical protein